MSGDPFTVTVHADFDNEGVWAIDARLSFPGPFNLRSPDFSRGRRALLEAILREERRGREVGALWVRVHLEAGNIVKDFHVDGPLPDLDWIL